MKVLTADQMREVDRLTIERGVPSLALMENAAHRVMETLEVEFEPIGAQRIVILCGKGNNGGDGLALARLLGEQGVPQVRVVLAADPRQYSGDAAVNLARLAEAGIIPTLEIPQKLRERREVTVVVDALLGTGLKGPASGRALELIRATRQFPEAKIVSVDLPSGLGGGGEYVRANLTVTFTAPKVEHYLAAGAADAVGRLIVSPIGTPPQLIPGDLETSAPYDFAPLFGPRKRDGHKGDYGHVLVVGGAHGKVGAAAMSGLAAARMGAGLTTVACSDPSRLALELMTEPFDSFSLQRKTVVAVGPGMGPARKTVERILKDAEVPVVIDADALNSIAGTDFRGRGAQTVLTPHPGEMARLMGGPYTDPVATAREFASARNVCLVLKGHRTLVAVPNGPVWINLSGTPAMGKGGSGDILTGMIAGLIAQFPGDIATAVRAAVWLHGRAGELAAQELTEKCVLATDLLHYLPKAILSSFKTNSEEETIDLGRRIAQDLAQRRRGDAAVVVLLIGNLGAGKTTLAKGIVSGLGAAEPDDVTSPTFPLIHEYGNERVVYHVDLYRLDTPAQVATLGLEEIFDRDAVVLIEWGERFPQLMPADAIRIHLRADGDARVPAGEARMIEWE